MTATNATAALQAVIERLRGEADGGLLQGVGVGYEASPELGTSSVYAGGDDFEQDPAVAEQWGLMQLETVTVNLYIQVLASPPVERIITDQECSRIADVITRIFFGQPKLAGEMTWIGLVSGRGDYSQSDLTTQSIRSLRMRVQSYLSWGA